MDGDLELHLYVKSGGGVGDYSQSYWDSHATKHMYMYTVHKQDKMVEKQTAE